MTSTRAASQQMNPPKVMRCFSTRCVFTLWPDAIRVLVGSDDRFFPPEFQMRIAAERLGRGVDMRPGGHLIALARPDVVAEYLVSSE